MEHVSECYAGVRAIFARSFNRVLEPRFALKIRRSSRLSMQTEIAVISLSPRAESNVLPLFTTVITIIKYFLRGSLY